MFEKLLTQRILFCVGKRNEPDYLQRNKTSKCISIFLSGSDNSSLRDSILYTHTHKYLNLFYYYYSAFSPIPLHISLTSSTLFFTAIENYWNLKCGGCLRGEGWSSILLLQVPKYQWFGSETPTYVSPFQPYTQQLSPLMCRLHTIPHFLSQKTFFFLSEHLSSVMCPMVLACAPTWDAMQQPTGTVQGGFFDGCQQKLSL